MSCNDTVSRNVTFDWSLLHGNIDLKELLTCEEEDVVAAFNDTTIYLNSNLDEEGNCTGSNAPTFDVTVDLCSSNVVWLGEYFVRTCDPAIGNGTAIILSRKTLICDADLSVNTLPLYIAAAAFATIVISVTLFLYYKYTRIQIPEKEIAYQEALVQQEAIDRAERLVAENSRGDDDQDIMYTEEDMVALPYGETAASTKNPTSKNVPTTTLTSSVQLEMPVVGGSDGASPAFDSAADRELEEKADREPEQAKRSNADPSAPTSSSSKETKHKRQSSSQSEIAPSKSSKSTPKKKNRSELLPSSKPIDTGREESGRVSSSSSSPKPNGRTGRRPRARDPNSELVSTPGHRQTLAWWNDHGFPSDEFSVLLKVGVESPQDIQFVEIEDLCEFGMSTHVAREVVRVVRSADHQQYQPPQQARSGLLGSDKVQRPSKTKPGAVRPSERTTPLASSPKPNDPAPTVPTTVEDWWRHWQFPSKFFPNFLRVGVEALDDLQFVELPDLAACGLPSEVASAVYKAAHSPIRAQTSPARERPGLKVGTASRSSKSSKTLFPKQMAQRATPPPAVVTRSASSSTPHSRRNSPKRRPANLLEWWDGHGFPSQDFARFRTVGVEMLSDLQFVEVSDIVDAGFTPQIAMDIYQAAHNPVSAAQSPASAALPTSVSPVLQTPVATVQSQSAIPQVFAPDHPDDDVWTMLRKWCNQHGFATELLLETLRNLGVESRADLVLVEAADLVAAGFDSATAREVVARLATTSAFLHGADRISL